jgi:hypothetical protein
MNADTTNFQNRILERLRFTVTDSIDLGMVEAYTADDIEHFFVDRLVYRLRSDIWTEEFEGEIVKYPSTWVQAFKEEWFPNWLLKKYPVKYTSRKSSFKILYPYFDPLESRYVAKMYVDGTPIKSLIKES